MIIRYSSRRALEHYFFDIQLHGPCDFLPDQVSAEGRLYGGEHSKSALWGHSFSLNNLYFVLVLHCNGNNTTEEQYIRYLLRVAKRSINYLGKL
jgi:hypothetical protein